MEAEDKLKRFHRGPRAVLLCGLLRRRARKFLNKSRLERRREA
jgi:hypothetical protein